MEHRVLLHCTQELGTGPYPELDAPSPQILILFP